MTRHHVERIRFSEADTEFDPSQIAKCREIRRVVFIEEQSVPAELEWDGLDELAEHFMAISGSGRDEQILGTARMRVVGNSAKAERVAVLASARHLGLGRLLMQAIETRARERSLSKIQLNAQVPVVPFYEKLGYQTQGEVFLEAGIEHLAMTKRLA
jgi:predicted GNAT family N-acyltransferase